MSTQEFDYLRNLLYQQAAIVLDHDKQYLAESRLTPLVFKEGFSSLQEMLVRLRQNSFSSLHSRVVDAMTNNETWFFRDFAPYEALQSKVLPEMISKRSTDRRLGIWSAACSSGQEPYSIAMLLRERFTAVLTWDLKIRATDISKAILARAQKGRYSQLEVNRGMPAALLARYFVQSGLEWDLKGEVRDMVEFREMNLAEAWPDPQMFDVVLLRNVLIYFDVETKKRILAKVRKVLRPDGVLFLGCAETTLNLDDSFERVAFDKTAYYRIRR